MPPKKRVSAPPNRVYESTRPKHQTKLPEQKKRVRRSCGKKGGPRLDKPAEDDTLTQMPWGLTMTPRYPEEDEESEYEEDVKKRRKKRRKTLGDKPDTPQYHTQTISQMDWSFNSGLEENLGNPEEEEGAVFDGPYSSQSANGPNKALQFPELPKPAEPARRVSPRRTQAPKGDMPPPQTPRRIFRQEIPSSQSPATPISMHSGGSPRRSQRRSPLKEMSINTPIPFNTHRRSQKSPEKLPKLEVLDTFHTGSELSQRNRITSSSTRRSSVAKSVRFAIPGDEDEGHIISPTMTREPPQTSQTPKEWSSRTEILDSDAESEDDENPEPEGSIPIDPCEDVEHVAQATSVEQAELIQMDPPEDEDLGPETCYGEIGHETQIEAGRLVDLVSSNADIVDESEKDSQKDTFQERTQMMESQRLTSQHVKAMAPRTMESDVFISIDHSRVKAILNRTRDHETRSWLFPQQVHRIWMFERAPVSTLKYMAVIGPAKRPGEIDDETGDGNAQFNNKKGSKSYAYEIIELYQLADPLHMKQLVANDWLEKPSNKYNRVPPVVLDQLMANLLPPLFGPNSANNTPPSSQTDTQEVEEQLSSTIRQFTKTQPTSSSQLNSSDFESSKSNDQEHISSSPIPKIEHDSQGLIISSQINISEEPDIEETIPSSQQETTPIKYRLPGPSQATTVDLSQTQTPREDFAEIVFESPRRPIPSSTPLRLPTIRSSTSESQGPEPLVPFSMASSQLLTKSQMLPESLLGESLPGPPPFVDDSDDDEDAYSVEL